MPIAVCPGSFDPVTKGHLDIIKRASVLFEEVIVLVVVNVDKRCSFSLEERCEMIRQAAAGMENVRVDHYDGLLVDYVRRVGAQAIVKGLRAMSDFEYEFQMALTNKKLLPYAETVFLTTSAENMYVSSSLVRQVAGFGGDIRDLVPGCLVKTIAKRLQRPPLADGDKR
ncbi:MAG: pantetheine-phosphate adenylyltransferase [Provencibacterium sp.]|jgi:pantetheine-phosphate adenylyltransferase|nr:pantetheine-phosphate adenylyltransferase [Provencibacterium sp.]